MKIGIIGAGHIGGTLARLWAKSGYEVMISSRHIEKLSSLIDQIGSKAKSGTIEETAQFGDVVVLSIPLGGISSTDSRIANYLVDKLVIDTMNPFIERDGDIAKEIIESGKSSGEASQRRFPKAKIVRAFNSVRYPDLVAQAHRNPPQIAVPFSTDNDETRNVVMQLIKDAGFEPFNLGTLSDSKPQDPGGVLFGKALTANQIRELLIKRNYSQL